ncbi:TPA: extracellular matrix protein-binding adhesin Emp [Staphylococcus aureus]|nr:extracellular matrix protein-binding adhesin Emp [Staphylococcus aureus]HDY4494537.1 extracellular matrix protein-binding adhesin Emp [Staphylococcus aureus]HDY4671522.1 extracellular matrix protein-binding adhesin Emp [Staphylococcus aureus]HDY4763383.1 extracellular matrix protein-binding adhesin Emp [Staphylococcus aureus]HEA4964495.1 extracellular matrix protein-binding adhesin Emp [Staphylococcus aureus]
MKKKLFVLTMSTLFATQLINSNHANASTEIVDKNFVVPESGINKIIPSNGEFKNAPKVNVGSLNDNKNFVATEDKLNKIADPSAASKIVDKNFAVPESKLGNIVPSYKEINNRVNVTTNNPASKQIDKHIVVKSPEVNRFITQSKVNQHFITTQTHYKKVITSYKTTHVHKHINHATTSINKHFTVKPTEVPRYTHPSQSQSLIINHHFAVPGYHAHNFVTPGHASIRIHHFCVLPQINSFKVIPSYGHSSHRMHVPSFQNSSTSVHQNSKLNKTYNYKYFYAYKILKGVKKDFSFSKSHEHKNVQPALNIKNVNYQYAVPSYSPTHYVPEFKGSLPAPRV